MGLGVGVHQEELGEVEEGEVAGAPTRQGLALLLPPRARKAFRRSWVLWSLPAGLLEHRLQCCRLRSLASQPPLTSAPQSAQRPGEPCGREGSLPGRRHLLLPATLTGESPRHRRTRPPRPLADQGDTLEGGFCVSLNVSWK